MSKYENQVFTRVIGNQLKVLEDIRVEKNYPNRSDVIREAIEQYIQNEGNAIGSRRHFNRSMGGLLNSLKEIFLIAFTWLLVLVAQGFSSLLRAITKEEDKWNPMEMIADASKITVQQYPKISTTIDEIRKAQKRDGD